jgi:hypothetical protein
LLVLFHIVHAAVVPHWLVVAMTNACMLSALVGWQLFASRNAAVAADALSM